MVRQSWAWENAPEGSETDDADHKPKLNLIYLQLLPSWYYIGNSIADFAGHQGAIKDISWISCGKKILFTLVDIGFYWRPCTTDRQCLRTLCNCFTGWKSESVAGAWWPPWHVLLWLELCLAVWFWLLFSKLCTSLQRSHAKCRVSCSKCSIRQSRFHSDWKAII